MPTSPRETLLCCYRYDPLDRLVDCSPFVHAQTRRFYCKSRLATEIQGAVETSLLQHDDQLLAQQQSKRRKIDTTLLATDRQRSALNALDTTQPNPLVYTPYGYRPAENALLSLPGFNGERPDPMTGSYLLGNGYRAFNPVLMRFNSPDSWSPFGEGGMNAYEYCGGDPRNRVDPSGHFSFVKDIWKPITSIFKSKSSTKVKINKEVSSPIAASQPSRPMTVHTGEFFEGDHYRMFVERSQKNPKLGVLTSATPNLESPFPKVSNFDLLIFNERVKFAYPPNSATLENRLILYPFAIRGEIPLEIIKLLGRSKPEKLNQTIRNDAFLY